MNVYSTFCKQMKEKQKGRRRMYTAYVLRRGRQVKSVSLLWIHLCVYINIDCCVIGILYVFFFFSRLLLYFSYPLMHFKTSNVSSNEVKQKWKIIILFFSLLHLLGLLGPFQSVVYDFIYGKYIVRVFIGNRIGSIRCWMIECRVLFTITVCVCVCMRLVFIVNYE